MQDVEEEGEQARKDSRQATTTYQQIKKQRCDLFNKAFNHMSGCIDKIYKDLTKSRIFPTGGVGFLSLENAEVGHVRQSNSDRAGTVLERSQVQRDPAWKTFHGYGAAFRR